MAPNSRPVTAAAPAAEGEAADGAAEEKPKKLNNFTRFTKSVSLSKRAFLKN